MSTVVLDSFESENSITTALKKELKVIGEESFYFNLKTMNIKRCRGCGACGDKTPGKCILNDDMQQILKAIAKVKTLILLTPLRFGGYSSQLKIALDRFMVLGLPFYFVRNGTLFHKTRYGHKNYIGIAMKEEKIQGEEENFRNIVLQNAANLSYTGKALVFNASDSLNEIGERIREILEGEKNNEK